MQAPAPLTVRPLRERPVDLFFVVAFATFCCTSIFFDSLNAFGIPITPDADNAIARMTYELYAKDTDLLLAANPWMVQLELWISTFVFAPFYVAAIYALVKGRDWIHIPAIAFAAAMVYSLVLYLGHQFVPPYVSPNPVKVFAANGPYALIAVAFAYRMRKPRPFSET
ncbi:MAG: DUF2781 domain-containing protein [Deltaproteobacteria bacterium]|nr:DUF2781 domain-containing protein [Deltaproteobacteria bacterium]